ncbi:thermonuclease family protein [Mesorhizobium cantuariense]|uniref:Thermonuclease family protein n=1 Tax=Mesorhizobium cantuariense TaxID=1300275 RepID=A0ABV7MIW2_9HYPH
MTRTSVTEELERAADVSLSNLQIILRHAASILLSAALLTVAQPATAKPMVGVPSVVDGDTIEIHGQRIRLNGIDAPERAQLCLDAGRKNYRCGQKASLALADFLNAHRPISCIEVDRDQFRRMVAVCTAGGVDIGEWMVRKGYALDWPKYSDGFYVRAQTEAKAAKRGMWARSFERPWEWRKQMTAQ